MNMNRICNGQFWNSSLSWNTENPDFTLCFEKTVLLWIPCIFLWILLPLEIYYMKTSKKRKIPWNWKNCIKMLVNILLISQALIDFGAYFEFFSTNANEYYEDILSALIRLITFTLNGFLIVYNKKYGIRASGVQFLFNFFLVLCAIPQLRSQVLSKYIKNDYFFVSFNVYFALILCLLVLNLQGDLEPEYSEYLPSSNPCPEDGSGFLSRLFFSYYDNLAWKGFRKPLIKSDLWNMNPEDTCTEIFSDFNKHWKENKIKEKGSNKISLVYAMYKIFKFEFIFAAVLRLFQDLLIFVMPLFLRLLINFVQDSEMQWRGYFYAAIMFLAANLQTLLLAHYYKKVYVIGMRVRTVLLSVIFKKSLKMSSAARKEHTVGDVVNLMSVDVEKLVEVTADLHMLWSAPLQIILSLYFLWNMLGPSVLTGVAVLLILIPINGYIANKMKHLQIHQMRNKDKRVKIMNEIISGIKVIKLYAWEKSFQKNVLDIRAKEMKDLKRITYYNSVISFIWSCAPFCVSLLTFATYILSDERNILGPSTAFVSLSLFNLLRSPLSTLPSLFSTMIQAQVSIRRINKFINGEDIDFHNVLHKENEEYPIEIENGNFSWNIEPVLKNMNVKLKKNTLTAIVGPVGCGKSSLLSALSGEMFKLSGKVNVFGKVAYVSQLSWIQNASLRDNILFGSAFDHNKYNKIVEACSLREDFDLLPAADFTEIGEKGINLSGGQKQRVSLARALYSNADIYFLDDPLSAVDSQVGKYIFQKVIGPNGLLQNKTRIFVTHNLTFLPQCDNILILNNGMIVDSGNYKQLLTRKDLFAPYLSQHSNNSEEACEDDTIIIKNKKQIENLDKRNLIDSEKIETGNVKFGVYKQYIKNIGYTITLLLLILNVIYQCFGVGANLWLSKWSGDKDIVVNNIVNMDKQYIYLGVYGGLGFGQALSIFVTTLILFISTLRAAHLLHNSLLYKILKAPLTMFFDVTPSGRILNRFSKDIDTLDNVLPMLLMQWCTFFFSAIAILFIISFTNPTFIAVVFPIIFLYYLIQRFYISSSRQSKRLESITRSPLYSHFGETVSGAPIIRAFSEEERFTQEFEKKIDDYQNAYWVTLVANRWLAVRLEILANSIVLFAAIFAITDKEQNPGIVGLIISYALEITPILNSLVRLTSDLEANSVSIERIDEYRNAIQEADWQVENFTLPKSWPNKGNVTFKKYFVRYRPTLEMALKNIDCDIKGGKKIGIVGRTGAGKSTLTLSLFRIIEANLGHIYIDGLDISKIGLHDLRSNISIIPQESVLFSGSLRMNIDPFNNFSDEDIWTALEYAHLKPLVKGFLAGLSHEVLENGENFSVGQRQLICLCRALLRKSKILILDEATAAVDLKTDELIQKTIRSQFKDCTVLTIAHRLNTILDCDKIMVLDKGTIAEFDTPDELMHNFTSIFYKMCKDAGLL